MPNCTQAKWYISEHVCALCDPERHLAHVVRLKAQWFVFDATHPNIGKMGCRYVGSFAHKEAAMHAAESDVLGRPAPIAIRNGAPDESRVRGLAAALLRQTDRSVPLRSVA